MSTIGSMDLASVVMPGAQSLVSTILADTWSQARAALSRRWARRHPDQIESSDTAAIERAGSELDAMRTQALELAGDGPEDEKAARMQLILAGYLLGQAAARPELVGVLGELPDLLGSGEPVSQSSIVQNAISGTVRGNAVQAGDIRGNINFGSL